MIELHYPAKGDLPETSGEMYAQRKPVLAYQKSLGWTQAIRRQVGKRKFEWVCSDYDGNTLFSDDEITAWTELPEPEQLTEAKEIIKDLLDTQYRLDPYLEVFKTRIKRAEDFLSGVCVTKKTPQTEDCSTCIYQDGACYPSTTIFDKNKKCKSYVKGKSIQKTEQEENER